VSAGYFAAPNMDLIDLFIGSEGTLGVLTDVTLRVLTTRPAQSGPGCFWDARTNAVPTRARTARNATIHPYGFMSSAQLHTQ